MTKGTVGRAADRADNDPRPTLSPTPTRAARKLLADLNAQIDRIYAKLPMAFRDPSRRGRRASACRPIIQDGAPNGYYQARPSMVPGPRLYYINLKDTHDWPKFSLPTLTYHEARAGPSSADLAPAAVDRDAADPPHGSGFSPIRRAGRSMPSSSPTSSACTRATRSAALGILQSFLFRAVRLVVDTGMHAKRWSREQAIRVHGLDHRLCAGPRVQREIDRYCVWPGQACSYKVGHTVWMRPAGRRQEAARRAVRPQGLPRRRAERGLHAADGAGGRAGRLDEEPGRLALRGKRGGRPRPALEPAQRP